MHSGRIAFLDTKCQSFFSLLHILVTLQSCLQSICTSLSINNMLSNCTSDQTQMELIFATSGIEASSYVSSLSWKLTDLSNDLIMVEDDDASSNIVYNSLFQATIATCVNTSITNNKCFAFELYNYGQYLDWFQLLLDHRSVTLGNETTFYERTAISFCANNFVNHLDAYDDRHNLTISISNIVDVGKVETLSIENITIYEENRNFNEIDTIYNNPIAFDHDTQGLRNVTLFITDGCYKVSVQNVYLFSDTSGECVVFVDDKIVGYCYRDVKSVTDTSVVFCTNDNHISHCITPHFCNSHTNNISDVYMSNYEIDQFGGGNSLPFESSYAIENVVNQSVSGYFLCFGELSCYNTSFHSSSDEIYYWCFSLRSCVDVSFDLQLSSYWGIYSGCFSIFACDLTQIDHFIMSVAVSGLRSQKLTTIEPLTAPVGFLSRWVFGLINTNIMINSTGTFFGMQTYFAMFNVTLVCSPNIASGYVTFDCDSNHAFIVVDESCYNDNWNFGYYNCENLVNDINDVDVGVVNLSQRITQITSRMETVMAKCDSNDGNNDVDLVYDIGHSIYYGQDIMNSFEGGNICCRGAYSCGGTSTLRAINGTILCGGLASCKNVDFLWTQTNTSHAYCIGSYACEATTISSAGDVICGGAYACWKSVINTAVSIFCVAGNACSDVNVRQFDKMDILGNHQDMTVYSGNNENENVEIWFYESGNTTAAIYCESSDSCTIHCDEYSCNNVVLYCDGLCDIDCSLNNIYGCNISVYSASPTTAPTGAPTNAPTTAPTTEPTLNPVDAQVILTEEDVSNSFNIFIVCGGSLTLITLITACMHASKYNNQLFNWPIVLVAMLYSNDFISDVFFVLRLCVVAFDGFEENEANKNENRFGPFFILFLLSLIFVIVPFGVNLYQLHHAISKWSNETILKETCVSYWLRSNAKKLYFMAITTGSSFSAIGLANSYLFKLNAFSMGLSNYHRSQFRTKRFYSVVLLEV